MGKSNLETRSSARSRLLSSKLGAEPGPAARDVVSKLGDRAGGGSGPVTECNPKSKRRFVQWFLSTQTQNASAFAPSPREFHWVSLSARMGRRQQLSIFV